MTRKKRGRGFSYHDGDGRLIRSKPRKKTLDTLAIPPTRQDVWIRPWANGYILATGQDERRRRQYIYYHPAWIGQRERAKFDRRPAFGRERLSDLRAD